MLQIKHIIVALTLVALNASSYGNSSTANKTQHQVENIVCFSKGAVFVYFVVCTTVLHIIIILYCVVNTCRYFKNNVSTTTKPRTINVRLSSYNKHSPDSTEDEVVELRKCHTKTEMHDAQLRRNSLDSAERRSIREGFINLDNAINKGKHTKKSTLDFSISDCPTIREESPSPAYDKPNVPVWDIPIITIDSPEESFARFADVDSQSVAESELEILSNGVSLDHSLDGSDNSEQAKIPFVRSTSPIDLQKTDEQNVFKTTQVPMIAHERSPATEGEVALRRERQDSKNMLGGQRCQSLDGVNCVPPWYKAPPSPQRRSCRSCIVVTNEFETSV